MPQSTTEAGVPNSELVAINTATSILEWCGQRNHFARKYAILVKEMMLQLESCITRMPITGEVSPLFASRITSLMSTPYDHSSSSVSTGEFSRLPDSAINTSSTSLGQEVPPMETSGSIDMSIGIEMNMGYVDTSSGASLGRDRDQCRWSEQFGIYYPNGNNNLTLYSMLVCNFL